MRLRRGRPADAAELARLRWEFRAALGRPNETRLRFLKRCTAWMRRRLAPASPWRVWAAVEGDQIVGHVWLALIDKVPNPVPEAERHGYVTNVYVKPSHRGAGLGARLMATALAWCDAHGVDAVVLWPTPRSRELYARHGFAPPRALMERRGR